VRRVVLDTNVVLDCWVFDDPAARPLKAALHAGRLQAVRSAATDRELVEVLGRPAFGLGTAERDALIAQWQRIAALVENVPAAPLHCADPADQKFLDLALAARALALFTKDKALLATAARARAHGVQVVAPGDPASLLLFEDGVA
jgi:predicted nucleic acid-binding protein